MANTTDKNKKDSKSITQPAEGEPFAEGKDSKVMDKADKKPKLKPSPESAKNSK